MSFKDHFSGIASQYAAFRPVYPPALAEMLAELSPARNLAVDVGCGTGQLSTVLATPFAHVEAFDASAGQISTATPHERVHYGVAPAESLPLPDSCADLITVAQAAHWLDLPAFYAECRRIGRPGAVIALITYGILTVEGEPAAIFADFYHRMAGPWWPPERRHVETGYRSFDFPFTQQPMPVIAMTADWSLAALLGYVTTWSAVQAMRKAGEGAAFDAFSEALTEVWGDPARTRRITWPLSGRIGRL